MIYIPMQSAIIMTGDSVNFEFRIMVGKSNLVLKKFTHPNNLVSKIAIEEKRKLLYTRIPKGLKI